MKGEFPSVFDRTERLFVHAYWRWLLGWEKERPPGTGISLERRTELIALASHEAAVPIPLKEKKDE